MITKELQATLNVAAMEAIKRRHEYVTLEHLLYALLHEKTAGNIVRQCGGDAEALVRDLEKFFAEKMKTLPDAGEQMPEYTKAFQRVVEYALLQAEGSGQKDVDGGDDPGADAAAQAEQTRDPLAAFTTNLVERAAEGKIDPLIGRDAAVART